MDNAYSPTSPDSDIERLEHDPGPLNPRDGSKIFRQKMVELGAQLPTKGASKLFDEGEDDADGVIARRKAAIATKSDWENWSGEGPGLEKDEEDVGMGGVVPDCPTEQATHQLLQPNPYREWQLRRQASEQAPSPPQQPAAPTAPLLPNMGLFARLPGELRNRLYRLALLTPTVDEPFLIAMKPATCSLGPCLHARLTTGIPGLLSSCRQIRQEALPIFCAENTFKSDARTVRERCAAFWVHTLGSYARLIPAMILEIDVWESESRHSAEQVCRTYEIRLNGLPQLAVDMDNAGLHIDKQISKKEKTTCKKLCMHWQLLAKRGEEGERKEKLLFEFLGSDRMADLVYRCGK